MLSCEADVLRDERLRWQKSGNLNETSGVLYCSSQGLVSPKEGTVRRKCSCSGIAKFES